MQARRVSVIGLGLMGGSLARALAARGVEVLGYDREHSSLDAAVAEGIVHEPLDDALTGVERADVVVLATPVAATTHLLKRFGRGLDGPSLIMDVASTKRSIVAAAEAAGLGPRYVGAHPLTGSHRSGWGASRASLFEEARVFLCPSASTTAQTLKLAESFWRSLRAGVEVLDAAEHDEQMAWRSHLPQAVSTALALTLREASVSRSALGPGGRDMTRLAGGDPDLWTGIVTDNAPAILAALSAMEAQLRLLRERLAAGEEGVHGCFADGREWFDGEPLRALTPRDASA
ncbi:MAG: bifunctional prephenate dehydrogenase/3-phosphoshikimate 1-carboxyvinyltransferase [Gemmatimonadetes bacterium]|nr:bifunctional prephenate dehydrogenase/3-phosphoshikimate 1-carboxyvinyltransferase [Gemmatimonadota bacterium]